MRDLSCGDARIYLELEVRRVQCRSCDKVKRERLDFLAENLGRPHQMRFGAYSLYGQTHPGLAPNPQPDSEVAAN